jgi:hypothetical protein
VPVDDHPVCLLFRESLIIMIMQFTPREVRAC